jgi:predicted ferric reductase
VLGLSYYVRSQIGTRRWRIAHRRIAIGIMLSLAHSLGGG